MSSLITTKPTMFVHSFLVLFGRWFHWPSLPRLARKTLAKALFYTYFASYGAGQSAAGSQVGPFSIHRKLKNITEEHQISANTVTSSHIPLSYNCFRWMPLVFFLSFRHENTRSGFEVWIREALDMGRLIAWQFMFYGPRDELGGSKNNVALLIVKTLE
jgi:hypothetical protein